MTDTGKVEKKTYIAPIEVVTKDNIKVKLEALHVKNFKTVVIYIKLNLSTTAGVTGDVINALIAQYARVHDVGVGISVKSNIIKILPGESSVYIMTDEHHVLPNIKLFFKYIMETKLAVAIPLKENTFYDNIKKAVQGIQVIVYGKCASFIKKFPDGKSDKASPMQSLQNDLVIGKTSAGVVSRINSDVSYSLNVNTQDTFARLMIAILLTSVPFTFKADNIVFNSEVEMNLAKSILKDRKSNILVLKRFIEQTKPVLKAEGSKTEADVAASQRRFTTLARITLNLKGAGNPIANNGIQTFILQCKNRSNNALTQLSKLK